MKIAVFDTETVNTVKPFCYNVGVVIYDTEQDKTLLKKEWVIKDIWYNKPLFATAYYAEKRPIYVNRMRARKIKLVTYRECCKELLSIFNQYEVQFAYAYNSPFDDGVFKFNCEWFKVVNPFDNLPILDIATLVHHKIAFTSDYQNFCDKYELYTETGNYSTTAENVYRYITNQIDFIEEHTALNDSEIELEILLYCIEKGCEFGKEYKKYSSIPRIKELKFIDKRNGKDKIKEYVFKNCKRIRISKDKTQITIS